MTLRISGSVDPFFDAVLRRDPAMSLILLPPEVAGPTVTTRSVAPGDVTGLAQRLDDDAARLWRELSTGVEPTIDAWWSVDESSMVRAAVLGSDDVDAASGRRAVDRAELLWMRPGWSTFRAPDGLPRVAAADDEGRRLEVVQVPTSDRLALVVASEAFHVEEGP